MNEPLREDILARLAVTAAMARRPRKADLPAAKTIEISINAQTGERSISYSTTPAPTPPPRPLPVRAPLPRCKWCDGPITSLRPGFVWCGADCAKRARDARRNAQRKKPGKVGNPQFAPCPVPPPGAIRTIQAITAEVFGIPREALYGSCKKFNTAHPRQAAIAIARALLGTSTPVLGREFGRRDHTTIMAGIRQCAERVKENPGYAAKYHEAHARCRDALGLASQPEARAG